MRPIFFLDIDDVIALNPELSGKAVIEGFATKWSDIDVDFWQRIFNSTVRDNLKVLHDAFHP